MEKQKLWPFFLVLWRMTNVRENILRVQKVHWKLFGSDMIIFSGPKCCLKHNFLGKKGCFSGETFFWANISQLEEFGKLQGTIYQGAQGFLTNIVQVIRSFCRTCEVHKNNFSKRTLFSMKINFVHFFSYIRVWQTSRNIWLSSTWFSGNHLAVCKRIPSIPKRWLKTQIFGKKGYLPSGIFFVVLICRIMEYGKCQGTIYLSA